MITTIIGDDGYEHSVVTQQYQVGLYVIIDSNPSQQGGVDMEEKNITKCLEKNINLFLKKVLYYDY